MEYNVNRETREHSFTMRVHPDEITSTEDLKKLFEL